MRINVVGRGNVGGGLADLWERAGHQVTRIGRDGGEVSDAEVVLLAVPGGAIAEVLDKLSGIEGKTVIDATNLYGGVPPAGFSSNAEFVKSKMNGPTAKSFNTNFALLYARLGEARARPSNLWCGDAEAREVLEQLNRDADYDPVYMGPIENAAAQEAMVKIMFAVAEGHRPVRLPDGAARAALNAFYRYAGSGSPARASSTAAAVCDLDRCVVTMESTTA